VKNPKCFKCEAEVSKLLVVALPTSEGNMVLLFCNECGAIQGVVRK